MVRKLIPGSFLPGGGSSRSIDFKKLHAPQDVLQCRFIWKRPATGEVVRCIHNKNHKARHEYGLAWVEVGTEENVEGRWLNDNEL